ncbi:hypothetical protein CBS101457_003970 [Exobasidium rhododendri]|nr:hypothetical protein CBS101457_003970 [Exobasidium rhododendri]
MNTPSLSDSTSPAFQPPVLQQNARNISNEQGAHSHRHHHHQQQKLPYSSPFDQEREQSAGGWSTSSFVSGGSGPSSSLNRTMSKRLARGHSSGLGGRSKLGKKRDKHSLALLSIRELLKGRSCYDCLPVSFRLVVLDTKLVVKPALEVMWQAGVVSAPLWQSTSDPEPTSDSASSAPVDDALSPSALSAKLAASEISDAAPSMSRSPLSIGSAAQTNNLHTTIEASHSPSPSALLSESGGSKVHQQPGAPPPGKAGFAGMLTVNDIIHLIQYYYQHSSYDNAAQDVERFRLEMLREIEQTLHVPQPPLLSIEPLRPLFDACQLLIETHARRLPLLDYDEGTGMETVVSVLTQYRVLKFIAMNCRETAGLNRTLRSLGIGTFVKGTRGVGRKNSAAMAASSKPGSFSSSRRSSNAVASSTLSPPNPPLPGMSGAEMMTSTADMLPPLEETSSSFSSPAFHLDPRFAAVGRSGSKSANALPGTSIPNSYEPLATATLDTTVFDVVHIFSGRGISAVPILDEEGYVVDMYETVDVIDLVRSGAYQSLDLTIRQALSRRSKDFSGVMTCGPDDSLATIFVLLRTKRVHRLLILEPEIEEGKDPLETPMNGLPARSSEQSTNDRHNDPLAGLGEIKNRRRGKLVGILCLSDILRYIIGGKANSPDAIVTGGGLGASVSTTTSAMGDQEDANNSSSSAGGGGVMAEGEEKSSSATTTTTNSATAANDGTIVETGPRPVDMPPTIQEQPYDERKATAAAMSHISKQAAD